MFTNDDDEQDGHRERQLCDWCGEREAGGNEFVPGIGRLNLCADCSMLLLSSIIDG
jgi:hypothetical protein